MLWAIALAGSNPVLRTILFLFFIMMYWVEVEFIVSGAVMPQGYD
jgi:hypothetical protein